MALLAFIIYTCVRIVSANCVLVYTIERAYARAYICACTCIRVSLRLFTGKNANTVFYVRMLVRLRACICMRVFAQI